jgi:hypothetical protein
MNFVFEDKSLCRNFINNWEMNGAGSYRFTISPLFNRMFILGHIIEGYNANIKIFDINDRPENYIIPVGVHNDPLTWAGGEFTTNESVRSLFEFINEIYLNDLINKRAHLLIDSSLEGYHEDWVFDFFHKECEKRNIPADRIIFVTGNSIVEERYKMWLKDNSKDLKINPLPYSHFENDVYLNTFYSSLSNLPGNIFTILFIDKMGRNLITSISFFLSGLSVFGIPFIQSEAQGVILTT